MTRSKYLLFGIIVLGIIGIIFFSGRVKQENKIEEKISGLPQPLVNYFSARECGNAECEFEENSANCPKDCLKAELSHDKWTQVNGPYGGLITDLEKVGSTLWTATSFTYGLGGNGIFEVANKGLEWKALGGTSKSVLDLAVDQSDAKNIAFIADAPFILS